MMNIVAFSSVLRVMVLYLIHQFPAFSTPFPNDLGSALLMLGPFHFQFRISGKSSPCLSM
jgi:hypothetical protein